MKLDIYISLSRECCKAVRLLIFATILQASYDEERKVFISPDNLSTKKLSYILRELEDIISRSSKQKDNVKLKSFGLFTVAKKSEVQDLLDSILKIAYPYISQARKLTDMNKQLEYSRSGAVLKFSLLPEALPMGYEDKTPVIVGFQTNENGKKSVLKVYVWKEVTEVWYRHKNSMFCKPIISESAPVDMENAQSAGTVTLFALGQARMWRGIWGDYSLIEREHNGRPVYWHRSEGYCLYAIGRGWGVGEFVGTSEPRVRSLSPASNPTLCQKWYYTDYDRMYHSGDIAVRY